VVEGGIEVDTVVDKELRRAARRAQADEEVAEWLKQEAFFLFVS
jgi:hypothetical protein